ncbi:AEC family transporter [Pelomonas aquatica]|jgi:predicted permease|uniref:AEC family transporter n=1 Tax=Pelomonas aquatica TaxID=431058 RepID=UPI00227A7E05|nr:hypothetical protein [Pelomonas aquatica]MCY4753775.1 hypothetical protein [Pelomonas aquatica]
MPLSLSLFAPLLYLGTGLALGRSPIDVKGRASALLARVVIPFVIVYNIATARADLFAVIAWVAATMAALLALSRSFTRDPVRNLCFCYLNIGWLGLPVASSLFGDGAATVFVAAYVGSSLFGNSIGAGLMSGTGPAPWRQMLKAPPVWALLLGLALHPFAAMLTPPLQPVYGAAKFLMSFLGMAILGIWLAQTPLRARDLRDALVTMATRAAAVALSVTAFVAFARLQELALVVQNRDALYLMALLPPAANIVVLETHYLRTGRSASAIAAGTGLSLAAIAVFATALLWLRAPA